MGLRFRKSFKLFPGVRLNLSGSGLSASFGVPGATINVGRRGVRGTVGLPGSGISYSTKLDSGTQSQPRQDFSPQEVYVPVSYDYAMKEIGSASVERLTSPSLAIVHKMIVDAEHQRDEIRSDLREATAELRNRRGELAWKNFPLFRWMFKVRIPVLQKLISEIEEEIGRLDEWMEDSHVNIVFESSQEVDQAYGALVRAFEDARSCAAIWDVTHSRAADRVAERTTAGQVVNRQKISLNYGQSSLVRYEGKALQFDNANGEDILLYPGALLMERPDGIFALLDLRDVDFKVMQTHFIESEAVPPDTVVVDYAWAKANKNGSRDMRFNGNYQIPVCQYGDIRITSVTGMDEAYQLSSAQKAVALGNAFANYKKALLDHTVDVR